MHNLFFTILNGPTHYAEAQHYSARVELLFVLGALIAECSLAYLLGCIAISVVRNARLGMSWLLRHSIASPPVTDYTLLELSFPSTTKKTAFATEQQHILLRSTVSYHRFIDRLAGYKQPYSLELVGTRDDGIRYIMKVASHSADMITRNLIAFLPDLKIRTVHDYTDQINDATAALCELTLAADFVLPLQDHTSITEHDPIGTITAHMTKLLPDELIALQIVCAPVLRQTHATVLRRIRTIQLRLARGQELSSQLMVQRSLAAQAARLLWYPTLQLLYGLTIVMSAGLDLFSSTKAIRRSTKRSKTMHKRPANNPYERELQNAIKTKLHQPLFEVSLRLLVAAADTQTSERRLTALRSSFQPFSSPYQALAIHSSLPGTRGADRLYRRFTARTLSPPYGRQPTVLSSSELADLYHFPATNVTKTEGLAKSRSRELPAPVSMKHSATKLDVTMGANSFAGERSAIGMTLEQRLKHTYLIGKTGTGKTTLLKQSIYQDMQNGKGLAVFDPHGDLFDELLQIVPEHRKNDVIIFNPADRDFPIGLNILAPGIDFENEEDGRGWITSTVLSIFAKLTDEQYWGPRMEHILRSATLTALHQPNPSLYTLQRLLTDKAYQRSVAAQLTDPVLKQFWYNEMLPLGDMQLATTVAPLTHRLGHFITDTMSRHILLQPESTISMSDLMNEGKILLVNLSKGDLGEDQSFFFGTMLTSLIWMAAYQRTKIPEAERHDFFVYIDEFQNYAAPRFAEIASEGRKFHIALTVSHQNIAQIADAAILKIMVGNAHTLICLQASHDDEAFILPYMAPVVKKGDIVNLTPYHFYMKTTARESEDAFSGTTVPLDVAPNESTKAAVIARSRRDYATPRISVEHSLAKLFSQQSSQPKNKPAIAAKKTPKSGL